MRVLLVEDDLRLARVVRRGLEAEGFVVEIALDGHEGLRRAGEDAFDAILLDVMLPGLNGYAVCAALREAGNWAPVLMLTALDDELDEAEGLDSGADDFLRKPFSFLVLVARLRALVRRGAPERPTQLTVGTLRLDRHVTGAGAARRRSSSPPASSLCCMSWPGGAVTPCRSGSCWSSVGTLRTRVRPT